MSESATATIPDALVAKLRAKKQDHVLKFYEAGKLQNSEIEQLHTQLETLDLDFLESIFDASTRAHDAPPPTTATPPPQQPATLEPLDEYDLLDQCSAADQTVWRTRGLDAISNGHVAALVLSGGQGTRLGFAGPKGMYDIGLASHKSLFQLFAERLLRLEVLADALVPNQQLQQRAAVIPLLVMTSPMNHDATVAFFMTHAFFGLQQAQVTFFQQGTLPCFSPSGKLLLETPSRIATASDGNGGVYKALATSGALSRMQTQGVRYLHVFSVDNALCKPADPLFIGYCIAKRADCANKVVWKERASEQVGVVAKRNGAFCIVEYSEMDAAASERIDASTGALAFGAANICNHFYTIDFLVDVVLPHMSLEYHVAHKKIPIVDDVTGETYTPSTNSGIKLEAFIFDVFPLSQHMAVLSVPRATEFAPVKNPPGAATDSPDTARAMLHAEAAAWLLATAQRVLSPADAQAFARNVVAVASAIEISPLVSFSGEGLEEHVQQLSQSIEKQTQQTLQVLRIEPTAK